MSEQDPRRITHQFLNAVRIAEYGRFGQFIVPVLLLIGILYTGLQAIQADWIELVIQTHLPLSGARGADPLSRNHINVLSSDVLIASVGNAASRSVVASFGMRSGCSWASMYLARP